MWSLQERCTKVHNHENLLSRPRPRSDELGRNYGPFEQTERLAFWKLNQPLTEVDGDWPKYCKKTRSCRLYV
jgi:hypothetical protein